MQNRLSRRCRPPAPSSETSKRRSIPNSKVSHLTELRKAVHIGGLSPSLSSVSAAAVAAVGLGSMLDRFVTSPSPPPHSEAREGRGGYDSLDIGHDCAVPTRTWHIHFWIRLHLADSTLLQICIASHILGECEMFDLS